MMRAQLARQRKLIVVPDTSDQSFDSTSAEQLQQDGSDSARRGAVTSTFFPRRSAQRAAWSAVSPSTRSATAQADESSFGMGTANLANTLANSLYPPKGRYVAKSGMATRLPMSAGELSITGAQTPRKGRILLCGDAAHVHSPAGRQGMKTGIQDAISLARELVAVFEDSDERRLDEWARRRHRIATNGVSLTDRMTRVATIKSPTARLLRNWDIAIAGQFLRFVQPWRELWRSWTPVDHIVKITESHFSNHVGGAATSEWKADS